MQLEDVKELAEAAKDLLEEILTLEHPTVVAIDGRNVSGKTTFSERFTPFPNTSLVHTDDVA